LYQKALAINVTLLGFVDGLIFRAKAKRPIDWPAALARFEAVKRQTLSWRRQAEFLERKYPNHQLAKAQSLKGKIHLVLQAHLAKLARLRALVGDNADPLEKVVKAACGEIPPGEPIPGGSRVWPFPVRTVDELF